MHQLFIVMLIFLAPSLVFAQAPRTFGGLVDVFLDIISILILLIFAFTLLVFIWGLVRGWIIGGGDQTGIEKGKQTALWGVIGLVVMASLWGIIALIKGGIFGI